MSDGVSDVVLASVQFDLFVGECLCSSLKIKKIVRSDEKRREDGQTTNEPCKQSYRNAMTNRHHHKENAAYDMHCSADSGYGLGYVLEISPQMAECDEQVCGAGEEAEDQGPCVTTHPFAQALFGHGIKVVCEGGLSAGSVER